MAEKKCLACGEKLEELAVFHNMPKSAQEFPTREELATEIRKRFPITRM